METRSKYITFPELVRLFEESAIDSGIDITARRNYLGNLSEWITGLLEQGGLIEDSAGRYYIEVEAGT